MGIEQNKSTLLRSVELSGDFQPLLDEVDVYQI